MSLIALNLRAVVQVSFQKSELNNFYNWADGNKKLLANFRQDDVVCFLNSQRNQLIFVWGYQTSIVGMPIRETLMVLRSVRLRMTSGEWNPNMLQNYANAVGLTLNGRERFETIYNRILKEKEKKKAT